MSWGDLTTTSTVSSQNASRFITSAPDVDSSGGVDFRLQVSLTNLFVITAVDPASITDIAQNDPV